MLRDNDLPSETKDELQDQPLDHLADIKPEDLEERPEGQTEEQEQQTDGVDEKTRKAIEEKVRREMQSMHDREMYKARMAAVAELNRREAELKEQQRKAAEEAEEAGLDNEDLGALYKKRKEEKKKRDEEQAIIDRQRREIQNASIAELRQSEYDALPKEVWPTLQKMEDDGTIKTAVEFRAAARKLHVDFLLKQKQQQQEQLDSEAETRDTTARLADYSVNTATGTPRPSRRNLSADELIRQGVVESEKEALRKR